MLAPIRLERAGTTQTHKNNYSTCPRVCVCLRACNMAKNVFFHYAGPSVRVRAHALIDYARRLAREHTHERMHCSMHAALWLR